MSTQFEQLRRYVFRREHLRDYAHRRRCGIRHSRRHAPIYRAERPGDLRLDRIAAPENLLAVFRRLQAEGGSAPGADGMTYGDFTLSEMAQVLRQVSGAICQRRYYPYPTRSVLVPKSHGGLRELRLPTIVDRIVAKALGDALTHAFEAVFLPGVYGFRPRRGVWDMLLDLEQTAIQQGRYVVAQDDIRDAFPSVPLADAVADYTQHITDPGLLWLVETVLRGYEGQSRTLGIHQGSAASPITLNLRLHHALDLPYSTAGPGIPPWYRYVDNLAYLCQSVSEGREVLQHVQSLLRSAGFNLKLDTPPVNLRRQGARVEILGYQVSLGDGRLSYGPGRDAWRHLHRSLSEAHLTSSPIQAAQGAVYGWLATMGPALESATQRDVLEQIRRALVRCGLQEAYQQEVLQERSRSACRRWLQARQRAFGGVYSYSHSC